MYPIFMLCLLSLLCAKVCAPSHQLVTRAFMVTENKRLSPITNKDEQHYAKVFAYLRTIYPDLALNTFTSDDRMLDCLALLAFCETQTEKTTHLGHLVAQFKAYVQQNLQVESLADHCLQHNPDLHLSPTNVNQIIDDIIKVYFFTMQHIMFAFPSVQKPPQTIVDAVRTRMQSQAKRMRTGNAILVQIPIMDKVFTKEEEYESFRKCKTIAEIEKKVEEYEKLRTKNKAQSELQNEPPYLKYAIIMKGENQALSLPPGAPRAFQEAIDGSIAKGGPVCVEHKGSDPDGRDIEIGVCALAVLTSDEVSPEVPEDMVLQTAQAQAAMPFVEGVIKTAKRIVHLKVL